MSETIETSFPKNLSTRIQKYGGVSQVSSSSGISRQMLRRYMDGDADPGLSVLVRLSRTLEVSIDHLLGPSDGHSCCQFSRIPYFELSELPLFIQKRHQAYSESIDHSFLLSPEYMISEYFVRFDDLPIFYCDTCSMHPSIKIADLLVINRSDEYRHPGEGIYLLKSNDDVMVRRVQNISSGLYRVSADDPHIASFNISSDSDFLFLGKVIMTISST